MEIFDYRKSWCPICAAIVDDSIGAPHEAAHGVTCNDSFDAEKHCSTIESMLNWVVAGGESGPNARPMHPDWARSLRDQCAAADVPFFFKQWGEWINFNDAIDIDGVSILMALSYGDGGKTDIQWLRVGKKAAGRLLDGVLHNGMPA